MTELGHGSNVQGIETTAHFNPITKGFILHSPTVTSQKFWIGNLGKSCTMSVVFAKLILPNGKNAGPHAFVVQIRDTIDHLPLPGVEIGDCGEKIGF